MADKIQSGVMKCLSLWQPWATLLVAGHKTVETRGWFTAHRGPLLIHAAKKWDNSLKKICEKEPFCSCLPAAGIHTLGLPDISLGCIIGCVTVVSCIETERVIVEPVRTPRRPVNLVRDPHRADAPDRLLIDSLEFDFGNYDKNRYAWLCTCPVKFAEPVPFRGRQQLFDVPREAVARALQE